MTLHGKYALLVSRGMPRIERFAYENGHWWLKSAILPRRIAESTISLKALEWWHEKMGVSVGVWFHDDEVNLCHATQGDPEAWEPEPNIIDAVIAATEDA